MSTTHRAEIETTQCILPALHQLVNERRITEAHHLYEETFRRYFSEEGYSEVSPLPLISPQDDSVLFIGASISALKQTLESREYPDDNNGYFLVQECIRTHAYKYLFENGWIPYGQSYFTMATNLSRPGRFNEVLDEALDFTINHVGVPRERLRILSSSKYEYLGSVDSMTSVGVLYDTKDDRFYKWSYGMDGTWGEGLTICIYNPATDRWLEVGNIIVIYGEDGEELGIEFGYGLEFFLTAALGIDEALKLSKAFETFVFIPGLMKKYYSYIEIAMQMKVAGAVAGDKSVGHVYRQHLKALEYMASSKEVNRGLSEISSDMRRYLDMIGHPDLSVEDELQLLVQHRQRKNDYRNIVKRVGKYLWALKQGQSPKEVIQDPVQFVVGYLKQNGINPNEVTYITERLRNFDIYATIEELIDS